VPGQGCLLLAVWCLGKPDVQNRLAAERPASRLIWEQIWEQNTAKPAADGPSSDYSEPTHEEFQAMLDERVPFPAKVVKEYWVTL
jgi:hypothetical protein